MKKSAKAAPRKPGAAKITHFARQQKPSLPPIAKIVLAQARAIMVSSKDVQALFKVRLMDYWQDNVKGLDTARFYADVVKPAPDEPVLDAVLRRFGKPGVVLYKQLLPLQYKAPKAKVKPIVVYDDED